MSGLNNSVKEEIKAAADIVDVVSEYVQLKKVGKNYQGLCPFHQEKTPSFTVNPDRQFYYCFGCGAGGDVFKFLMEIENISFLEALKELSRRTGIPLPESPGISTAEAKQRDRIFSINELAGKFYHYLLLEHRLGKTALDYLQNRGFTLDTVRLFRLGYAPHRWNALLNFLQKKGFSPEEIERAGLVISRQGEQGFYDRFRERVIFPIYNSRGQIIGFGGRVIKEGHEPKYLNSPQTPIFNKSRVLYGLYQSREEMRKRGEAIIVEGYTDMISLFQAGFNYAVASLGTSLTTDQARILKRYVETVEIAYDADAAGAKATLRGLDILKNAGLKVRVVALPEGADPDQTLREKGTRGFQEYLQSSLTLPEFKINQVIGKRDLTKLEEKVAAVKELIPVFANIDNAVERDLLMEQVGEQLEIPLDSLKEDLEKYLSKKSKKKDRKAQKWNNKRRTVKIQPPGRTVVEEEIIRLLLMFPELIKISKEELNTDCFSSKPVQNIYQQLLAGKNFSEIYDNLKAGERDILLKYGVKEEEISEEQAKEKLRELVNIIKQQEKIAEKQRLLRQLENNKQKGSLEYLNRLLLNYHDILVQENSTPERGDNGGKG